MAAGFGGAAAASPWLGLQALWIGLALFTLVSAGLAVKRILPRPQGLTPEGRGTAPRPSPIGLGSDVRVR
ncbi:hypothetical protein LUW74_41025 [Actinomadura madurae]|uniref:hypothetical protein n=1 Tax=Actinomadura madurae TaxID=1993 RepID=UPI0020264840|nr:hypothetical protein [Actinomadura madurae]URN09109.1 hypothetical protein LUW74_41025 [Actinomadura madurae]